MGSNMESPEIDLCTNICVLENETAVSVPKLMIENGQTQPFYMCNMDDICHRILHFKELMPRIKLFYAIKCNDTSIMLKLAIAMGTGFACASPREIHTVKQMNVSPKSILYYMPKKTPAQMKYAREVGVTYTTFDSSNELRKLKDNWPDARLLIHIKCDNNFEKFGCDETEAFNLLEEAASLGLNVIGVSFHVAAKSPGLYVDGIRRARLLFDYEARADRRMSVVNIGGGLQADGIYEVSKLINETLNKYFQDPEVNIIATPGKYLCESGFSLYCSISGVRAVKKHSTSVNMIYLNDGIYGTMRLADINQLTLLKKTESNQIEAEDTILWGPTCDSLDQVMTEATVLLPKCSSLDWLVFNNHGAYTFSFMTNFSSLPMPLIRPVVSKELWCLLKNEAIFKSTEVIFNTSSPLQSTMPPVVTNNNAQYTHLPTLNI